MSCFDRCIRTKLKHNDESKAGVPLIFLLLDNALSETDWPSRAVRSVKSFLGPVYMEAGDPR